jgi:hypothetical protein
MGTRDRIDGPGRLQKPEGQTSSEARSFKPGLELRGKHPVGRDPREMTRNDTGRPRHCSGSAESQRDLLVAKAGVKSG